MNTEAHLAVGWVLANATGEDSRRWRGWITFAALAPDLDALSYVFGEHVYADIHHSLGHNVFFSVLLSVAGGLVYRRRPWKAALLTQAAFYTHYFGDYFFTRFPLLFFWPVSDQGFVYSYRIGLDHPINLALGYASIALSIASAWIWRRTPMELLWPALDRRFVNLLGRKDQRCHLCAKGANERCASCDRPVCPRHARLNRRMEVRCAACVGHSNTRLAASSSTDPAMGSDGGGRL